ncbi:lysine N(6)-hydroxylase/L-ornithine N(5)-oxygenase family protein [Bradyrhizobium sp. WSM 1744]|uniref:Lysine N(6)-hydroxylase/L-ornithine N(5)-oxygenase family protein n=1 Tax=Bradyrhizobium archetypum TaxID=2721160 RepID=A0A7Y4H5J2_9BRAD|nr:lysine N(6)-hydroxylase/L-ornithine N(5)-oxygenase family protein [Bradyrhizobium archetypum]
MTAGQAVTSLRVHSRTLAGGETIRLAKNLVVAAGGSPYVPPIFQGAAGDSEVIHSIRYLDEIETVGLEAKAARVAVIGRGQSATEVTVDLRRRFSDARIDLIFRGHALKPSDSSPFVNEIFNPDYTDFIFAQPDEWRNRSQLPKYQLCRHRHRPARSVVSAALPAARCRHGRDLALSEKPDRGCSTLRAGWYRFPNRR